MQVNYLNYIDIVEIFPVLKQDDYMSVKISHSSSLRPVYSMILQILSITCILLPIHSLKNDIFPNIILIALHNLKHIFHYLVSQVMRHYTKINQSMISWIIV